MTRSKFPRLGLLLAVAVGLVFATSAAFAGQDGHALFAAMFGDTSLSNAHLLGLAAVGSIKQLGALQARRKDLLAQMSAITSAAGEREDGLLTAEERSTFDTHAATVAQLDGDIARVKSQIEATRTSAGVEIGNGAITTTDNLRDARNHGFRSFGEFAFACVRAAVDPSAQADDRLQIGASSTAPGSYGNSQSGADGGYLVPPEFSTAIVQTAYSQNDSFVPMTDNTPVSGNSMTFPVDETTPWGSSGVKAYWTVEGDPSPESKIKLDPATLRLKKLTTLVPLTEEMLADAAAIGAYVQAKVPEAIAFKTNEALWSGSGAGKPKGFYASTDLLVSVAKESGQASNTIVAQNLSKMRARMHARSYRRAVWHINNDCLPQLDNLLYATTATNEKIYNPNGGRFGYGTILGRDVMVTDFNETVGTKGDIVLADWGMYRTITKSGGLETATSMHFWFDRGHTAFRTIFRIDGQPSIAAPVTPNKGSAKLSPIVTLDARA